VRDGCTEVARPLTGFQTCAPADGFRRPELVIGEAFIAVSRTIVRRIGNIRKRNKSQMM
jgi:hypothetical protein